MVTLAQPPHDLLVDRCGHMCASAHSVSLLASIHSYLAPSRLPLPVLFNPLDSNLEPNDKIKPRSLFIPAYALVYPHCLYHYSYTNNLLFLSRSFITTVLSSSQVRQIVACEEGQTTCRLHESDGSSLIRPDPPTHPVLSYLSSMVTVDRACVSIGACFLTSER